MLNLEGDKRYAMVVLHQHLHRTMFGGFVECCLVGTWWLALSDWCVRRLLPLVVSRHVPACVQGRHISPSRLAWGTRDISRKKKCVSNPFISSGFGGHVVQDAPAVLCVVPCCDG